jgi:hypothetical protein
MDKELREIPSIEVNGTGNQVSVGDMKKSNNTNTFSNNKGNITIKRSTAIISLIASFIIGFLSSLLATYIFEKFIT